MEKALQCDKCGGAPTSYFQNICTNEKFLYNFSMALTILGMPFCGAGNRPFQNGSGRMVFPVSDHSSDAIAAPERNFEISGGCSLYNPEVNMKMQGNGMASVFCALEYAQTHKKIAVHDGIARRPAFSLKLRAKRTAR